MSYLTVEVEITQGRVVAKGGAALPDKAQGLLTILSSATSDDDRPIGLARGQFVVPDDFNDPLPGEVLRSFEGA